MNKEHISRLVVACPDAMRELLCCLCAAQEGNAWPPERYFFADDTGMPLGEIRTTSSGAVVIAFGDGHVHLPDVFL